MQLMQLKKCNSFLRRIHYQFEIEIFMGMQISNWQCLHVNMRDVTTSL
jgi:hypothetical protein